MASDPEAWVAFLRRLGLLTARAGLEAGPVSQRLHGRLRGAGFGAVPLETRHVKAALPAMAVKTGRRDARGVAQLLRMPTPGIGRLEDAEHRCALKAEKNKRSGSDGSMERCWR